MNARRACLSLSLLPIAFVCCVMAPGCQPPPSNCTATIGTSGDTFTPAEITVHVGDTVCWQGLVLAHNVAQAASATAMEAMPGGFTSGPPSLFVSSFSQTFTAAGDVYYICEPHIDKGMRGVIHVLP